ncbi:MAG: glycosyltransferase [Bryobacteraceae bacterium]|nr:glycosyltransferase [Bryobacteraceae bacterium]MDW8379570.1 glycosyltransferase [Bryobacterales bacterium]
MAILRRLLVGLPFFLLSPILLCATLLCLLAVDLCYQIWPRRRRVANPSPSKKSASVVIPNWNGRDLLEKYLPSVVTAMQGNPDNEIIVVDNGSSDGSVAFLKQRFPNVRVIALAKNVGFGGGANLGFREAKNDIVILLNSDMRVASDFLAPLLEGFEDDQVFAVSCQIFFTDPDKLRQETGLTQGWWRNGKLGVRHRVDDQVTELFPCFYPGGGSSAYDRRKFLELGGFDHLYQPFYFEDTDLGFQAWKRGWKVYYQPRSHVWHEHRATIGKHFSAPYIQSVLHKNQTLFAWKNIHEWDRLLSHFFHAWADATLSYFAGPSPERISGQALFRAFVEIPRALASRWRAHSLATLTDTEAFRRPLGGYFRDRFHAMEIRPERLSVLFVSPYPICPPVHGGGVFMHGTATMLAKLADLHLIVVLDEEWQQEPHQQLVDRCVSASFLVRPDSQIFGFGSMLPHAVREYANQDLEWMIHRTIYLRRVDVLQLEYTHMGQYAGDYRRILKALFEHDVYFQSVGRSLLQPGSWLKKLQATLEYLRAIRYELAMLETIDQIQTCSLQNKQYLESFSPHLAPRIEETLRAGIDTSYYSFSEHGREPDTMLFLGSFRHLPNQEALDWFTKAVLPRVVERRPQAKLVIIGSDPPPRHSLPAKDRNVEILGFVEDLRQAFARYAVFVCPILSGSGVRVKLLEAFCTGIPVVSTRLGAEGLTDVDGEICFLADTPADFAKRILDLFDNPHLATEIVRRAHRYVTAERDIRRMTERLVHSYRQRLAEKRLAFVQPALGSPPQR